MSVPNYITLQDAIQMRNKFKTVNGPLLSGKNGGNYEATDFVWVPLSDLKAIVEELWALRDEDNRSVSGLRLYFGIGKDSNNEERETLFFAPTVDFTDLASIPSDAKLCNLPVSVITTADQHTEFKILDELKNVKDIDVTRRISSGTEESKLCDAFSTVPPPQTNE